MNSVSGTGAAPGSGAMFDRIAARYDALNRILSFGVDRRWRRRTVAALRLPPGARVLDLATGTADLAIAIAGAHPDAEVVGLDPSGAMLRAGRRKVAARGLAARVQLDGGTAEVLPFADASFDAVTIAFGIRNVPDRPAALREMARVTRPGGRVAVLELAEPRGPWRAPARFWVRTAVPVIGALLSGAWEYRYLQRSIAAFPAPPAFAAALREAGLDVETVREMTFGSCCLFVARRPAAVRGAA